MGIKTETPECLSLVNICKAYEDTTSHHVTSENSDGNVSLQASRVVRGLGGGGTWWRSWLRHCATNRKVTGSIPDGINGIFH